MNLVFLLNLYHLCTSMVISRFILVNAAMLWFVGMQTFIED